MARFLTPEGLIKLFGRVGPEGQPGKMARSVLSVSKKSRDTCAHLLHLFDEEAKPPTLWDIYLAHYRLAGKVRWLELVQAGKLEEEDPLPALIVEPAALRWGLAEGMCETSRQQGALDPSEALRLAGIARDLAKIAPVDIAGLRARHELLALTWATEANAHRNADCLEKAREAMSAARPHLEAAHPLMLGLLPTILSFQASLEFWERLFEKAMDTVTEALALEPEGLLRARLLVKRGNLLVSIGGRATEALEPLNEALPLIDRESEPRLWLAALAQQLLLLTELNRLKEAEALLPQALALIGQGASEVDALQLRWVEARIASGAGAQSRAEGLYDTARKGFLGHGLAYRGALVTLELCHLLMEQGRLEEVKTLAASTLAEFHRQKVQPEFVSALALVEQAVKGQRLSLEVLNKARGLLQGYR